MSVIHLHKSLSTKNIIRDFITEFEYLLPDPFSLHVNLSDYSEKLNTLGETFVVTENNKVVGLVCGYINDLNAKQAYMQILIVSKEAQGKGYASMLIKEFIGYAKFKFTNGQVFLTVDKVNDKAENIYKHLGFVQSDRVHVNKEKRIMVYNF